MATLRPVLVVSLALAGAATLTACPIAPLVTAASPAAAVLTVPVQALGGNVFLPPGAVDAASIVAAGGGNIVAAGGGNIVAQGGGNIVAAGGGNIVAEGGGNFVGQNGSSYRLDAAATAAAATETSLPVVGAIVTLRDAATRARYKWAPVLQTDASGKFQFPALPAGLNYIVEADFVTKTSNKPYRMLSFGMAGASQSLPVSWCTTAMLGMMMNRTDIPDSTYWVGNVGIPQLQLLTATLESALAGLDATDLAAKQRLTVGADSDSVSTGTTGAVTLTVPDLLTPAAMGGARDVMNGAMATSATMGSVVQQVTATASTPLTSAQQALIGTTAGLAAASGPTVTTNGRVSLVESSPSPSPAP